MFCIRFQKYYKSLFLGLVDMALVNCYISHTEFSQKNGKVPMDHHTFLNELQTSLTGQTEQTFTQVTVESPATSEGETSPNATSSVIVHSGHNLIQSNDLRENGGQQRRRSRTCKVCSIYKVRRPLIPTMPII